MRKKLGPLGETVTVQTYVDSNHLGDLANRVSYSMILIYVNNSMINFYRRRQNTVESSSFGSEFVALITTTEMVEALRYKLRELGLNLNIAAKSTVKKSQC